LEKNKGIDFLRGLGCFIIMLYHAVDPDQYGTLSNILLNMGHTAMSMFFTASAYMLTSSSSRAMESGSYSHKSFWIRRFFRIIPVWWFFLIFSAIAYQPQIKHLMANVLFYFGFLLHIKEYNFIALSWSLFVEVSFYLLFPVIFVFSKGIKKSLFFVSISIVIFYLWNNVCMELFPGNPNFILSRSPLYHVVDFALGIFIYYIRNLEIKNKVFNNLGMLILFLLSILFSYLNLYFISGSLIFYCFFQDGFLKDFVSNPFLKIFQFLGVRCLSLYLVHDLILMAMIKIWKIYNLDVHIQSSSITYLLIYVFICFSLIGFTYKYIECNSMRLGELILARLKA
jgi:peptidoglycan/LPS O-acetylase OafA/YrhL